MIGRISGRNGEYRAAIGIAAAEKAAEDSGLPGLTNGPADAYRHLVGACELTRRFGPARARMMRRRPIVILRTGTGIIRIMQSCRQ
jgi:hypothetical protein